MSAAEYTYASESVARQARRMFINQGHSVSLISYDGGRGVYVFDVLS